MTVFRVALVALMAPTLITLGTAPASAAPSKPVFKIVKKVDLRGDGQSAGLVLPGRKSGWGFWSRATADGEEREFVARRWDGKAWRASVLPAGMTGVNAELHAGGSSGSNVWVVQSEGLPSDTGQVEGAASAVARWDGRRWAVVKRFEGARLERIAVHSLSDVRAFGTEFDAQGRPAHGVTWRFNGKVWRRTVTEVIEFDELAIGSTRHTWALGGGRLMHFDGVRWKNVRLGALLPKNSKSTEVEFTQVLARGSLAVVSGTVTRTVKGQPKIETFLLRWVGRRWSKERPKLAQGLSLQSLAPDGRGGLWVLGKNNSWARGGDDAQRLFHRDAKGQWQRWMLPFKPGRGYYDELALLPGTTRLVATGTTLGMASDGLVAVLK